MKPGYLLHTLLFLGFALLSAGWNPAQAQSETTATGLDRATLSQITEKAHRYYRSIHTEDYDLSSQYRGELVGLLEEQVERLETALRQDPEAGLEEEVEALGNLASGLSAFHFEEEGAYAKAREAYPDVAKGLQMLESEWKASQRRSIVDE